MAQPLFRLNRIGLGLATILPLSFCAVFFLWPVGAIIFLGFQSAALVKVLASAETWNLVGFTVLQASGSTIIAIVAGFPLAFILARCALPGRLIIKVLVTVPFVLPTVVVGLAFRSLLGSDSGVIGIMLANAFFNIAVVVRIVGGLWERLDRRIEDSARTLGAAGWRVFSSVTFPLLRPAIASAASVVFLFCATSFGVVLILGGTRIRTIETEIYLRTTQLLDLPGAAALSIVQLIAVVLTLAVVSVTRRRSGRQLHLRGSNKNLRRPAGVQWLIVASAFIVVVALLLPMVSLLLQSLRISGGWSVQGYWALASGGEPGTLAISGWQAAINSFRVATDATVFALALGIFASLVLSRVRRRGNADVLDLVLMLPLGVSAVTVGFGYVITLTILPNDIRSSPLLVPLAQAVVIIPLISRTITPVLHGIDDRLRQSATTLGASPLRVLWEIDLRLASRSILAAAGLGFVVALGEFGATSFLARPEAMTLPVAIARLIARPGELNESMAYAACVMLMVLTGLAVAGMEKLHARSSSGVWGGLA